MLTITVFVARRWRLQSRLRNLKCEARYEQICCDLELSENRGEHVNDKCFESRDTANQCGSFFTCSTNAGDRVDWTASVPLCFSFLLSRRHGAVFVPKASPSLIAACLMHQCSCGYCKVYSVVVSRCSFIVPFAHAACAPDFLLFTLRVA